MSPDILIIRDGNGYRILHGHLRLASELSLHREVDVDVADEGRIRVVRTRQGYFAASGGHRLPILRL
ncbi:hypothetical protein [Noviherbaspirillum sp. UKPF54]|uniref:hypothetical protein n=1 Tax=Noviherbaspirillum sp. UKPF54 TaxID=2601898 RepID=UPI0011B112AD|nr:hypothetical protein [Noviherbaspirillum sp. UKPF54]QDZ26745.1 hypothetical protein FAY22_01400 [Noviherbaspirillum sp. UKPF54]